MEAKQKKQSSIVVYLNNLSKKDKVILAATIIITSLTLGLKFVILPQLEQYTNNLMTLDQKNAERARLSEIPIENKLLEEKAEELKVKYDRAFEEISKTPAVAKIIYDLKGLISSSGVEMESISFSEADVSESDIASKDEVKTDENGAVTEIDRGVSDGEMPEQQIESEQAVKKQVINISLNGKYDNIMSFIKAIENYSRVSEVSNISLSQSEDEILSVSLTANFYNLNYNEGENYDFNNRAYGKENSFN